MTGLSRRALLQGAAAGLVSAVAAQPQTAVAAVTAVPTGYTRVAAPAAGMDAAPAIQAVLNGGGKVALSAGNYICQRPLLFDTGSSIWGAPGARLLKGFNSSGATRSAFLQNRTWPARIRDVSITGVGFEVAALPGMGGNLLSFACDRLVTSDWSTGYYTGGRWMMIAGDNIRCTGHKVRGNLVGGSGDGGLRFAGGRGFRGANLDIVSGDDVFQFVPAGAAADPLFNIADTIDCRYDNCVGRSLTARLCVVALQDANNDGSRTLGMRVSVRDCSFNNITGYGGGSAVVVKNASSTGEISNLRFTSVAANQIDAIAGQPAEVYALNYPGLGAIRGVNMSGITVKNPHKRLYRAEGPNINVTGLPRLA